jgi:AraC-like DNA-binding protein
MYTPVQPGIPQRFKSRVVYKQHTPASAIDSAVHCFWTLHTRTTLDETFPYLALPDGCVDIVFDMSDTPKIEGALVMTPGTTAITLELGTSFAYIGIRLKPGTWRTSLDGIVGGAVEASQLAGTDLRHVGSQLRRASAFERLQLLEQLASRLDRQGIIGTDKFTSTLATLQTTTVDSLAPAIGCSRRQLQRFFKQSTGYSPHAFLAIIRFQQAIQHQAFDAFADQSHYIRECKRITGMTPRAFYASYGLVAEISNTTP